MSETQQSNTENVKLGPCKITYDGVDLGYTKGGVEVTVETSTYEVTVDQFGEAPVDEYITGRTVTVSAPLAETTKENLEHIMPGASLVNDGAVAASGEIAVNTNPTADETLTINGVTYMFKDSASLDNDNDIAIAIGLDANDTAAAIQAKLSASSEPKVAVAEYAIDESVESKIVVTYKTTGEAGNKFTMATNSTGLKVSLNLAGGANGAERVEVTNAVGASLLKSAKQLRLHPIANADDDYSDDFVIPAAGVAGGMNYSYMMDQERTYPTEFKGYPKKINGKDVLFYVGAPIEEEGTSL